MCVYIIATDARRALPCFDEPSFKARFTLTLYVPHTLSAISNMNVLSLTRTYKQQHEYSESESRGLTIPVNYNCVKFAATPVMSTYLLAWYTLQRIRTSSIDLGCVCMRVRVWVCVRVYDVIFTRLIGEFDYISSSTASNVSITIYTPLGKTHLAHFAADVANKALTFYNEYFGIECNDRHMQMHLCHVLIARVYSCHIACVCIQIHCRSWTWRAYPTLQVMSTQQRTAHDAVCVCSCMFFCVWSVRRVYHSGKM